MATPTSLPPPEQLFTMLQDKKSKFSKLPEHQQERFLHFTFKAYLEPRLRKSGLDDKAMGEARDKFTARMRGKDTTPFSEDFARPEVKDKPGAITSALGAAGAKLSGMVKNLAEFDERAQRLLGDISISKDDVKRVPHKPGTVDDIIQKTGKAASEMESVYDIAAASHPMAARAGALGADIAASGPIFEGAGIATQPLKNKLLRGAASGAAGMVASSPLYGTKAQDLTKQAAAGAVGGAVFSPLIEMLGGKLGTRGKAVAPKVSSSAPVSSATNELDTLAMGKFKKPWGSLTPEERHTLTIEYTQQAQAARPPKEPKVAKPASVPQEQKGTPPPTAPKDSPVAAKTRQQEYIKLKRAGLNPQQYRDQIHAGRTASEIIASERGGSVGEHVATTGIAMQETPEVQKAVTAVASLNPEAQVATPKIVKEGQHGTGEIARKAKRAEYEAKARAKAASQQPSPEVGYTGSGEEGKGTPVPIAKVEVPVVELISGLKALKAGGMDGSKLAKLIEGSEKFKGLDDIEKRAALEKTYQAIAEKLGIEGAGDKSIDDLYVILQGKK